MTSVFIIRRIAVTCFVLSFAMSLVALVRGDTYIRDIADCLFLGSIVIYVLLRPVSSGP